MGEWVGGWVGGWELHARAGAAASAVPTYGRGWQGVGHIQEPGVGRVKATECNKAGKASVPVERTVAPADDVGCLAVALAASSHPPPTPPHPSAIGPTHLADGVGCQAVARRQQRACSGWGDAVRAFQLCCHTAAVAAAAPPAAAAGQMLDRAEQRHPQPAVACLPAAPSWETGGAKAGGGQRRVHSARHSPQSTCNNSPCRAVRCASWIDGSAVRAPVARSASGQEGRQESVAGWQVRARGRRWQLRARAGRQAVEGWQSRGPSP